MFISVNVSLGFRSSLRAPSTILSNLALPLFMLIKPYLFTSHMIGWKGFFDNPVPWAAIGRSAVVLATYTVLFLGVTVAYFNKKDIQS
ncbi:MAG: hypothetical protein EBZ77_05655 [Chitinophagia bacterium]|nr:hypothetical protein [Chitinophagia bacterium]